MIFKTFWGLLFPLLHGPNDSKATARRKQQSLAPRTRLPTGKKNLNLFHCLLQLLSSFFLSFFPPRAIQDINRTINIIESFVTALHSFPHSYSFSPSTCIPPCANTHTYTLREKRKLCKLHVIPDSSALVSILFFSSVLRSTRKTKESRTVEWHI